MSDETEDDILTPEEEASMIWSDRPVIRRFECPIEGCNERLAVHGDVYVEAVAVEDGGVALRFIPKIWADDFDQHFALDHGIETGLMNHIEEEDD